MSTHSVLLVDGDPKSLKLMEVGLRREGHEVIALGGAEAARAWPEETPPSLIVAASDLPGEDGLDLLAELRERQGWGATPSLVLTPERTQEVVSRAMALGAEEFLTRPVFVRELLARVRMVLERHSRSEDGAPDAARSGELDELALVDLLTGLEAESASGVVYLESGERRGRLFLREGRVVDAKVGGAEGSDAALRVFRWHGGSWTFDPREVAQRDRIGQATTDLLAEAMERAQTWSELWANLPGDDPVMEVDFQGVAAAGGELPSDAGKILRLFDGVRSASRVVEDSPFDELATLRAVVRMFEQGLLSAPEDEDAGDDDDDEPTSQLSAWLDDEDDEDRTPTGVMPSEAASAAPPPAEAPEAPAEAPPTDGEDEEDAEVTAQVVVLSPDAAAAAEARARAEEILREAEEARAAAERARIEAEAAREAAEQARAVAEAASAPAAPPAAPPAGPPAAPPAPAAAPAPSEAPPAQAEHDIEIERDPSDEIPTETPEEGFGAVEVLEAPEEGTGGVAHDFESDGEIGAVQVIDDEERQDSLLPDIDTSILDGAGPPPEDEDAWGDFEATIDPDAPPLDNPDAPAPDTLTDGDFGDALEEEFRIDTSAIVEEEFAGDPAEADAPPAGDEPPAEVPLDDGLDDEFGLGDGDVEDDPWGELDDGLDIEGGAPDTEVEAEAVSPDPAPQPEGEPEPAEQELGDVPLGEAAQGDDDDGEFDWAAELDEDETVPSLTPPPAGAEEIEAAKDELEDFGWGDSDEEDDDDLDWGDALEGAGDEWQAEGGDDSDTDADVDAFDEDDGDLPPPAAPPTAVDVETVKPGGGEADEWEQALAEGDELYEEGAPPPLEDAGDDDFGLGDETGDDLDLGDGEQTDDDVTDGEGRQDSGPIDLSQFASRKHSQVKGDSGGSIWLKIALVLILLLVGLGGGGFLYLDAQRPPPPLAAPGGAAKPRPPRVDDANYPLGMKAPKSVKRRSPDADKPLPPPVDEGGEVVADAAGKDAPDAPAKEAPPVPLDIAEKATGAALEEVNAGDSVAAQLARRKTGAALPPDKASRKLHKKHFKRAEKLRKKGKNEAAVEEYTQAMAHRPGHVPTLLGLGNAYFDLGRPADARVVLAQALKADPKNGKAWLVYGMVLQEEREKEGAIKAYRQFLELRPEDKYASEVESILRRLETE